jgi:hypothetical protein
MNRIKVISLIVVFFFGLTSKAQEYVNAGFYAGGQASTNGLGLQAGYILNKHFTFKTGFETMNLAYNYDFEENDITYNSNLNYKTGGFFLLADYFATSHLYLSAGGIINSFNPKIDGIAVSDMKYGDITIPAEKVGGFKFDIKPGLKVAPYAGLGFRQFIGKKERVLYNLEAGLYYMGSPEFNIEANGLLSPTADPAHEHEKYLENQFENYMFYPIVKFNLAVRLF